jgi:hypothetical protein
VIKARVAGVRATVTGTACSTSELGTGHVESDVCLLRRADRWLVANF